MIRKGPLFLFYLVIVAICFFQIYLFVDLSSVIFQDPYQPNFVLIWWTPFYSGERLAQCGEVSCLISSNRKSWENETDAILFYGTRFEQKDLPLRRDGRVWGLLHEESPRNSPLLGHESLLSLFNFSATFSRFSHLPLVLQYAPSLSSLLGKEFYKTFDEKTVSGLAPVVYIQSDCITPNNRDSYVAELMKHIQVDSYGACLNNRPLPPSLRNGIESMMSPELLSLVGNYKFSISFENALCDDYITEKLWRPLIAGSIPIYVGSKSVKDWLPFNDSVIMVDDFTSPKALADYLHYVNKNSSAYYRHLKHKSQSEMENPQLASYYKEENFQPVKKDNLIEKFECLICRKLHQRESGNVDKSHYNCYEPVSIVDNKYNASNWWHGDYFRSKCEADLLREYLDKGIPRDDMKFHC